MKLITSDLVYGNVDDMLVFVPREVAIELATLWGALLSSSTWGEFRRRVSSVRYGDILELASRDWDDRLDPEDNEDFFGADLPGVRDGDYPEWPAQLMLQWVPTDVADSDFADIRCSVVSGECLFLDPIFELDIVELFYACGFRVGKDEQLVLRAHGR
jgi:hypothetical protein